MEFMELIPMVIEVLGRAKFNHPCAASIAPLAKLAEDFKEVDLPLDQVQPKLAEIRRIFGDNVDSFHLKYFESASMCE